MPDTRPDACAGASQGHYLLGLRILNLLVTEMNQPTTGRTLTQHRKLAVAFRDNALLKVFQLALGSVRTLAPPAQCSSKLQEQVPVSFTSCHHADCVMKLAVHCLNLCLALI